MPEPPRYYSLPKRLHDLHFLRRKSGKSE